MTTKRAVRPLGDFECAVLLAVMRLGADAYGVPIRRELEKKLKRAVSFGAVYTTLERLLQKGLVSARVGEPTPERGGRAKKYFVIEADGIEALDVSRRAANAIWAMTPARSRR